MITYTYNNTLNPEYSNNNKFYFPKSKSTDYSKILDDLIFDDIMDKNDWLSKYFTKKKDDEIMSTIISTSKKEDDLYKKALAYFSKPNKYNLFKIFKKDTDYTIGGTTFCITDDYIHIGDKTYWFDNFNDENYIKFFTPEEKKILCIIYTDNLKITIKG